MHSTAQYSTEYEQYKTQLSSKNNILTPPDQFHHILHIKYGHNLNFILNIMFCKSRSQITVKQTTQSNVYTHI